MEDFYFPKNFCIFSPFFYNPLTRWATQVAEEAGLLNL